MLVYSEVNGKCSASNVPLLCSDATDGVSSVNIVSLILSQLWLFLTEPRSLSLLVHFAQFALA